MPKGCRLTHGNLGAVQDATLPLITLDADEITAWAAREGLDPGPTPSTHPAVHALIEAAVAEANATLFRPARIRAFHVLPEDFTTAAGTPTPTLKLRRAAVAERYAEVIAGLYGE
ncbi:hypothetical protein OG332_25795 [Streptomyces sp. NBC_01233]|nr:hypothetical protein OG332_25795 [Streptomyces sp. NBC_01233]